MWKRLPLRDKGNKGRQNQIQIGSPTLLESTYDEHQLDRAQNLSPTEDLDQSPYYNADIRPSRSRQDVEANLKLPTMNFGKQSSYAKLSHRPSVAASSVYSQPDDNISPPSSPYRRPAYDDGQVSPIEERSPIDGDRSGKSHIPVPRKITPRMKEWTQNVGKGAPMMWDDYSGEPTFDGAGKPSQVKPGEFDYRSGLKSVNKLQQPSIATTEAHKAGFKEKASKLAQRGLSVETRPPWKGSSGRHAIVDTPRDKPGQAIPQPRRPEVERATSAGNISLKNNARSPTAQSVAPSPETRQVAVPTYPEYHPLPERAVRSASSERQIYSSPTTGLSPYSDRSATSAHDYAYSTDAPANSSIDQPSPPRQDDSRAAYANNDSPPRRSRNTPNSRVVGDSPSQQPDSRFSWTTTATSTYQRDNSPPPSPPPPMPTKYLNNASPEPKPSILDRGHPTRNLGAESPSPTPVSARSFSAGSTLRKPVGSPFAVQPPDTPTEPEVIRQQFPMADWRSGVSKQRSASFAPSTFSNSSQTKLLPKTPQELSSVDLIASLQAQQSDLSQQRRNIQRIIGDLEKPEAKNPLTNSFKVIREREKQLETLKLDLADVIRKDHELGMRLHRAWKRRERDDPNTPGSTFWVRRATAG